MPVPYAIWYDIYFFVLLLVYTAFDQNEIVHGQTYYLLADENEDPASALCEKVLDKADVIQAKGSAITQLYKVQCLTPRGRYDVKIYPTFLHLHGKTFDFKLTYTSIIRLFLLPHKGEFL